MIELGIESSVLQEILAGNKTVEGRLGKGKFLEIRPGDELNIREDIWKDNKIEESFPSKAKVEVTQVLHFKSFSEMLRTIDYRQAIPGAKTLQEAVDAYGKFYSPADEERHGVVALVFRPIEN